MGLERGSWNWAISLSLLPCAPPSLLQPFQRHLSARLPPLATLLPRLACPGKPGASQGAARAPQTDGTLRCPAGKTLYPTEQRREADGTLRVLYAARSADCRSCRLRKQCQWHGRHTKKPRRVSILMHPLQGGSAPLLWRDWSRREHRRACMQLLRHQRVDIQLGPPSQDKPDPPPATFSRAQRAHYRLSWHERLARNARDSATCRPTITLFGVPDAFAAFLGMPTQQ